MARENISPMSGKVRDFYFESGKIDILRKSRGKLKLFNKPDLNIWSHFDLNKFLNGFVNEVENFVHKISVLMDGWKGLF